VERLAPTRLAFVRVSPDRLHPASVVHGVLVTISVKTLDVLLMKLANPLYVATTLCEPAEP